MVSVYKGSGFSGIILEQWSLDTISTDVSHIFPHVHWSILFIFTDVFQNEIKWNSCTLSSDLQKKMLSIRMCVSSHYKTVCPTNETILLFALVYNGPSKIIGYCIFKKINFKAIKVYNWCFKETWSRFELKKSFFYLKILSNASLRRVKWSTKIWGRSSSKGWDRTHKNYL